MLKTQADNENQGTGDGSRGGPGNISLNKSKQFEDDLAVAQRLQAEEFNGDNSRTGANSDEARNHQDYAQLDGAPDGMAMGAELDSQAYQQVHGVR